MRETWNWLTSVDIDFLFLLMLPFVVGLLGLAQLAFEKKDKKDKPRDDR